MVKPLRSSHASPASCREIPVAAVDQPDDARAPAVRHFQQHRTVSLVRILRPHGDEVRRKLDLAILQVHRFVEINDAPVVRIRHGKREINAPGDALVSARVAELFAAQNIVARGNLDANHARVERQNGQNKNQRDQTLTKSHARKHSIISAPVCLSPVYNFSHSPCPGNLGRNRPHRMER